MFKSPLKRLRDLLLSPEPPCLPRKFIYSDTPVFERLAELGMLDTFGRAVRARNRAEMLKILENPELKLAPDHIEKIVATSLAQPRNDK